MDSVVDGIIHLYVNTALGSPQYCTIGEALESVAVEGLMEKCYPAPEENITPVIIHVGAGIYREKLVIDRPYVTLEGAGQEDTVLVYGDYAKEVMEDGTKRGTFRTASIRIDTHDFTARNMTFQNDAGYGHTVGQALAFYMDGDRNRLVNCSLLGSQDTLFTAPLPPTEAQPGGFIGPGEKKPRIMGRHYYKKCYIEGDVDFIFGGAIAYFDECTIYSRMPGDRTPPESPKEESIYGYITAASTPAGQDFGYVLNHCTLLSDCPKHSIYLGRPWREHAKTVYLHCDMGAHIHPAGWQDWGKPHGNFYYGEYNSMGPGAQPQKRASFSHQLTEKEASVYTIENIFEDWNPLG